MAPLRLATICLDDAGVRARLDEWYFALEQVLDRVQGRMEWSVKAFSAAQQPEPSADDRLHAAGGRVPERRTSSDAAPRRRRVSRRRTAAASCAEEVYQQLATVSVASRRLRPRTRG